MFTISKGTPKKQPMPPLRTRTLNGLSTLCRIQSSTVPNAPQSQTRRSHSWSLKLKVPRVQSVEKARATLKRSISPPSPISPVSSRPAEAVASTVPVYGAGTKPTGVDPEFYCTKWVLVASGGDSRPSKIRRVDTRKELPWVPISKPLPALPNPPFPSSQSITSKASQSSSRSGQRNSFSDSYDDGLDDLALFLRRIAYDAILAPTIHRHLGFVEDGGRVLPLGRPLRSHERRSLSPPRRYSSLMGVSLAIMEGRLPKALMCT